MELISVPNPKGFFQRSEGKTGIIFGIPILLGLMYVLYIALPYIIVLFKNTFTAIFLGLGLFILLFILLDKRVWTLGWYVYKMVMRWITEFFVNLDPIAIIEIYIDKLKNYRDEMSEQIRILKGVIAELAQAIDVNKRDIDSSLKMASQAQKADQKLLLQVNVRKAKRREESNIRYADLKKKLDLLYQYLIKMYDNTGVVIEDISDEVTVRKKEQKAVTAGFNALKSAWSVINGDPDKRAMFDMAMEKMAEDIGTKVGAIEDFIFRSREFMNSIDLQNNMFYEEGLKMLDQLDDPDKLLISPDEIKYVPVKIGNESVMVEVGKIPNEHLEKPNPKSSSSDDYTGYFKS